MQAAHSRWGLKEGILVHMIDLVVQLIIASAAIVGGTTTYIDTLPPAPDQTLLKCRDASWVKQHIITVENAGIHKKLAPFATQALQNARQSNVPLRITVAHRSCAFQQQLRAQNCGLGDYNLFQKPSDACTPPTEPAGKSLHNEGLAIDFGCDGYGQIESSPCYPWLKQHGARYHLKEHALEPWHWSTTGK